MSARLYVGDGSGPAVRPRASTTVVLRMAVARRTRWPATGLAAAPKTQFRPFPVRRERRPRGRLYRLDLRDSSLLGTLPCLSQNLDWSLVTIRAVGKSVSVQRWLTRCFYTLLIVANLAACSQMKVIRQITIDADIASDPFSIVRADDGGFLVAVQSTSPKALKIDGDGNISWWFEQPNTSGLFSIGMVTSLPDGGAIVCGARATGGKDSAMLPGFVIRLDASGREIARLDPGAPNFKGRIFYDVMTCAPWGDGFAISVIEPVNDEIATKFNPYANGRTAVKRLTSDLSLDWSKHLKVGGLGSPTRPRPLELPSGDLVFPSGQGIYILNTTGGLLAEASMEHCQWVRSASKTQRLRFVCLGDSPMSPATVVEYDGSLRIRKRTELIGSQGLPMVAETVDDGYLAAQNGSNSRGPEVAIFDINGKQTRKYSFPHGGVQDIVPAQKGTRQVVILRYIITNTHFAPNISWLAY